MKKLITISIVALFTIIGCAAETITPTENGSSDDASQSSDEGSEIADDAFIIFNETMSEGYDLGAFPAKGPTIDGENEVLSMIFEKGQSVWIFPDEEFVDISEHSSMKFTYTSDEVFSVRVMWGELPDGHNSEGAPYWEGNYDDKEGGFIIADSISASSSPKDFSIDFDDMLDPAHQFHVEESDFEGDKSNDLSKVHQIVFLSENSTLLINKLRFE
ncbi:MAG: hypothetical protein OCC49_11635 [Fibrobacterales bacterium]